MLPPIISDEATKARIMIAAKSFRDFFHWLSEGEITSLIVLKHTKIIGMLNASMGVIPVVEFKTSDWNIKKPQYFETKR